MNLHKLYYKEYFKGIDFRPLLEGKEVDSEEIKKRNRELCNVKLVKIKDERSWVNCTIPLKILYPGLVTGVGINHEAKVKEEFKLGVHFDWTYGKPVIYGSSVKGVLRAYFKEFYKPSPEQPSVEEAFEDIFEGGEKSIYKRDIFFDAVITQSDSQGHILCSDSITPHGDNPLKNPKPISFLKIAPGCTLEFRFKLNDTTIKEKTFTKDDKKKLFKEILTTVGVGAKTNVGYGQLE